MSLNFKIAWGIELGNSSVSAVKIQMTKGQPEIAAHHIVPYDEPVESDEDFHDKALVGLSRLIAEAGLKKTDAVITSVPGRSVFSRPVTLPPMDPKRIPELIKYEASQQIPFPIEEVVWDYYVSSSEEAGEEIAATIFAIRREEIDELISIYYEAGLELQGIQTTPLALLNFVRHDTPPDQPCLLIDIKSSNIDFIVHGENSFYQRNIARGGNDINKALMSKFKIPYAQAEELKQTIETNQQAAKILQVIQPVFKNMTNEIQRSIGHYRSQNEEVNLKKALLLGNAVKMKKLVAFFKATLRLDLELITKLNALSKNCYNSKAVNKDLPSLIVPIGLALQGVGASSVSLNLIPQDVVLKRVQAKKIPWMVASCVIFLFGGWTYFNANQQATETLSGVTEKPKAERTKLQNQADEIKKSKEIIEPEKKSLFQWKTLLRETDTLYPRDAFILAFDQLHQTLIRETTDDKELIFIEDVIIEKITPEKDSLKKKLLKQVKGIAEIKRNDKELDAAKIIKISLTGTFFEQTDDKAANIEHVVERVVKPLNANSTYFTDWTFIKTDTFFLKENEDTPMQKFKVEGYFIPSAYREFNVQ